MSNEHTTFCDLKEMYVLGGLSEEETAEFEQHLPECSVCGPEVAELRKVVNLLPLAVEQITPQTGMKQRILGNILNASELGSAASKPVFQGVGANHAAKVEEPQRKPETETKRSSSFLQRLAIYGLSAAVLLLCVYSFQLTRNINDLKLDIALATGPDKQPIRVNEVVSLSQAAKDIVAEGLATIVIDSRGTHLLVQADKLPELKGKEAYQVWLIKGEQKFNAGTFLSHQGKGALYLTFEPESYDTIAVTLEPDAEGTVPRGSLVLAAPLTKKL